MKQNEQNPLMGIIGAFLIAAIVFLMAVVFLVIFGIGRILQHLKGRPDVQKFETFRTFIQGSGF